MCGMEGQRCDRMTISGTRRAETHWRMTLRRDARARRHRRILVMRGGTTHLIDVAADKQSCHPVAWLREAGGDARGRVRLGGLSYRRAVTGSRSPQPTRPSASAGVLLHRPYAPFALHQWTPSFGRPAVFTRL